MVLKRKLSTPQQYIQVGIAFFLLGVFISMVADSRVIGAFFASFIADDAMQETIKGAAAGILIPVSCASIYFNLRGLVLLRSR